MKILQVGSGLFDWGGIERYVVYLTNAQRAQGDQVVVTLPAGSPLAARIPEGTQVIPTRRQIELRSISRYLRLFQREKFDVVNVHFSRDYVNVGIAGKLAGVRETIMTRHVAIPWKRKSRAKYLRLYDGFIGVSEAVRQKLIESDVPENRVVAALSGAPSLSPALSRDEARAKFGMEGFCAVFVGRMIEDKGPQLLGDVAERFSGGTVHAFGDGPLLSRVRESNSRVVWHGRVEDPDDAMLAADAVLIPSQWEEAFGYVAIEAMSLARPVVAARSGGLVEIFRDGVDGFLVDRRSPDSMAQVLGRLRGESGLAEQMGAAAKARKEAHFEPEHMASRVRAAYEELQRR
jgi:glycosyltransferase involved in cell wall biosynthesis